MLDEKYLLSALNNIQRGLSPKATAEVRVKALQNITRIQRNLAQRAVRCYNKEVLIQYKGGVCERCGGRFPPCCLDFHHTNPRTKNFKLDKSNMTKNLDDLKREADLCNLLCANCHRQVHEYNEPNFLK